MLKTASDYENMFIIISDNDDDIDDLNNNMYRCQIEDKKIHILGVDIGIHNLGISLTETDSEFNNPEVIWFDLINITEFNCDRTKCPYFHEKTITDWMAHVFEHNRDFFEKSDYILIERQPLTGLTSIEQFIFAAWRRKSILISPSSVHKYFKYNNQTYEQKKISSEQIALRYLEKSPDMKEIFYFFHRRHDISDSILFTMYWCEKQYTQLQKDKYNKKRINKFQNMKMLSENGEVLKVSNYLEQFSFNNINEYKK